MYTNEGICCEEIPVLRETLQEKADYIGSTMTDCKLCAMSILERLRGPVLERTEGSGEAKTQRSLDSTMDRLRNDVMALQAAIREIAEYI